MLAAPTKKTKSVDWGAPLREYISKTYGETTADEQIESLSKLNQTRDWVLSNSKKADDSSLQNIKTYLRMLGSVEARFPIRETEVNLNFTWYDSFQPKKKFTHHRIEAEKASVLFNYAAMESYLGMSQDRSQPAGVQAACAHFLTAARYFQYLRDVYIPEKVAGPMTSDMSQEGLTMLTSLMLAQAQACFFEKAVKNKLTPSVLAKLAAGAKELYSNALQASTSANLTAIIDASWGAHLQFQLKCFAASSAYQYSKVLLADADSTGEGYGKRIAFMKLSVVKCDEAILTATTNSLPTSMLGTINSLKQVVEKDLVKANSENSTIYMDVVPDVSTLDPVAAHILAKADVTKVDLNLIVPMLPGAKTEDAESGTELFGELLPSEVQLAVAMFSSRISDMTERVTKMMSEKETDVTEALKGANLPAAIEAGDGQKGLPDGTWAKVLEKVHHHGGINGLKSTLIGNSKLAEQLNAALNANQSRLQADEAADVKNRQVWGPKWTLPLATEANSLIKKDCARFKGYLTEARSSDNALMQKMDAPELKQVLEDLSMQKNSLDMMMPDPGVVDDDPHVENLRSNLRMSFIKLQTSLQDGKKNLEDLKYEAEKDSIIGDLYAKDETVGSLVANENKLNSIIENKMRAYEEPVGVLEAAVENFTTMLSRVLEDNSKYLAARRDNAASIQRESSIARIENGIDQYTKLLTHIEEGKKFYAQLTEKVNRLTTLVGDHCLSRDLLGKEMEQNLIRGVENQSFNPTSAVVPQPQQNNLVPPTPNVSQPISNPWSGQTFNNPSNGFNQQPAFIPQQQQTQALPQAQQAQMQLSQQTPMPLVQMPGQTKVNNPHNFMPQQQFQSLAQPQPIVQQQQQPQQTFTGMPQVQQYNQPATLVQNPAPVSQSPPESGKSMMDQLREAQEKAERDGTLSMFAGTDLGPQSTSPAPVQSDIEAAQSALQLEQQEIMDAIRLQNVIQQTKVQDYAAEVADAKQVLGNTYPDDFIRSHVKATNGSVTLAVSNIMDGVPLPQEKAKKKGGFRLFGRKKNKGQAVAGMNQPVTQVPMNTRPPAVVAPKPKKPGNFEW